MELTMFERLLQLPLFQGLTTLELSEVMEHVRLNFVNYHEGDEIVMQGDACHKLVYVISGDIGVEYREKNGRFTLVEDLPDLKVLEPFNMFGMIQKYSRSYFFNSDGCTLTIERPVVLKHLMNNNIIRINLLNIACNKYQQTQRLMCEFPDNSVRHKMVKFMLAYSTVGKGRKEFRIKMTELADIVHETRLNVSVALNEMQAQGLLTLQRGGFIVENLENLYR